MHHAERHAISRLQGLLQHAELEDLLGPLLQTVRQVRKEETGTDRRGTKAELAAALVLQHGIDLFQGGGIRQAVARACAVRCPERWHAGKPAAIDFVVQTEFPRELAGIPTAEGLPDYEYLEGRFTLHELWPFQKEVKRKLCDTLNNPGDRALVTLPTGGGKTRVAVEGIRDWLTAHHDHAGAAAEGTAVLWLAHTEELCEQACACFKQVWEASPSVCPLLLVRFWGNHTRDLAEHRQTLRQNLNWPSVLVSTPQRVINLLDGRIAGSDDVVADLRRALGLLLVDEAHRAAAPSYRRVLAALVVAETGTGTSQTRSQSPFPRPVSVAGLTATPFRMEYLGDDPEEGTRELKEIFHRLIEPADTLGDNPRLRLQEMGVLARPVFETIDTPTTMTIPDVPKGPALSEEELERIDRVLAVRADNTPRRLAVLRHLLPIAHDPANSVLYFGPSVRDAECMAFLLRRADVPAAVVSGTTRDVTRRQVVTEFKQKKVRVLCNCEVLTTGFDAPQVTHVVMARPTVSRVLYEQILGRGLRGPAFGGTPTCAVLDCRDNFRGERPPLGYESFRRVWQQELRPLG